MPPALFIMGPTASGKTALAIELVKRFPFEIISVDSALVYRDMDIGTAKPDTATLRVAPHRLIDILDPSETYSAARFCSDARAAIEQILSNERIPLLVGGTMLYYRALQLGLSDLPPANPQVRARLEEELVEHGLATLYARLVKVDPLAVARIHPNDYQRIQRALEVYELTGRTMTELCDHRRNEMFMQVVKLIIAPQDRQCLHQRIERRFKMMLEQGFVTEVASLRARSDLSLDKPSMRAVGYRQVWQYLEGLTSFNRMVQTSVEATRQFAKRQLTWLRTEPKAVWLDSCTTSLVDQTINYLSKINYFQIDKRHVLQ
jgi:tRNA dimethylallyltransferase